MFEELPTDWMDGEREEMQLEVLLPTGMLMDVVVGTRVTVHQLKEFVLTEVGFLAAR